MLGKEGVNINYMSVAPVHVQGKAADAGEALMILGVDRPVSEDTVKGLLCDAGVLEATLVSL